MSVMLSLDYIKQEAKESFASPDHLYYGKSHNSSAALSLQWQQEALFICLQYYYLEALDQGGTPL